MVIDDFHNGQMVPLGPEARAGMPTLPYVDGNSWVIIGKRAGQHRPTFSNRGGASMGAPA